VESNNGLLSDSLDNALRQDAVRTLHQQGYQQLRTLEITIDHGSVIVEGFVPTWHLRQIAMECIRRVAGVGAVVDRIRVVLDSQDDDAPYFKVANVQPANVQPATEQARLELEACPTAGVPGSGGLAASVYPGQKTPVQPGKNSSCSSVEDEREIADSWFQRRTKVFHSRQP